MVRRTKEASEQTRETLLDAAEMVFLEKGVNCASLEEIARRVGMTRGAVYWHFDNKAAIVNALHERVTMPLDEIYERALKGGDTLKALETLCVKALQRLDEDERLRRVYSILFFRCEQPDVLKIENLENRRKAVLAKFQGALEKAQQEGILADGIQPERAAIGLHAYLRGLFFDFLRNPSSYDLGVLAPCFMQTFFAGLRKK